MIYLESHQQLSSGNKLLSDLPVSEWQERFAAQGVPLEDGPVAKTGAKGPLISVYVRDPDGNLIEISNQLDGAQNALRRSRKSNLGFNVNHNSLGNMYN